MRPCDVPLCPAVATVGFGQPPMWLCIDHFDEQMQRTASLIKEGLRGMEPNE